MLQEDEHIGEFGPGEEGASAMKSGMERAWYAHMAGLRSSYNRAIAANPVLRDARIDTLLDPVASDHARNATNWSIPNEIEILLVRLKTGSDLEVALDSAFTTAQMIMVPSVQVLAKRRETAATDDDKQAVLAKLLRDTHNRYAARRSERVARRAVANRMTKLGFGLTAVIVGSFILFGSELLRRFLGLPPAAPTPGSSPFADLVTYNLCVTTFFGFLGAYLSRLIAFQKTAPLLSYEELENGYSWNFLMVRLLVGGLSSVIVYFVISGRLIAGELFPEVDKGATGGFGPLWTTVKDGAFVYDGPSANYAKLIVWCFIAGFSERFLPDHLSALEAKSKT
ncbi:MAG: hypothetical protein ACKO2N_15955 [Tabrizicola sp.]